jgi:Flp pilus assembly pilin Flp
MSRRRSRAGVSQVQWVVIAALITLAIVGGISVLGTNTNTKLNETATDVGNPQSLTTRFGS